MQKYIFQINSIKKTKVFLFFIRVLNNLEIWRFGDLRIWKFADLEFVWNLVLGIWNLFGIWCLEFGICLEFGAWNLEFNLGCWIIFLILPLINRP